MRTVAGALFVGGLLLVTSFGAAQPPGGGKGKGEKGGPKGDKGGGPAPTVEASVATMMGFDANKDGKLTKDEVTDRRLHRLFERADADKDGAVTAAELTALFTAEAAPAGGRGGPGGGFPGGPPDGFGPPDGGFPGGPGGFGPPRPGQILPGFLQGMLELTDAQQKQLDALQKEVDGKLDKILTADQRKRLKEFGEMGPPGFGGPGGFPGGPPPGFGPPDGDGPPPKKDRAPAPKTKEKKDRPPADEPAAAAAVRGAVSRALPVLRAGAAGHSAERSCFTCHNHALPLLALVTARSRGFEVTEAEVKELTGFVADDMTGLHDRLLDGRGPGPLPAGGGPDNTGYAMLALAAGGHPADDTTAALAEFTINWDKGRGYWFTPSPRPPSEHSSFTVTALSVRGLQKYATPAQKERADKRVAAARGWLLKTAAKDTEDRVFRLIGLQAAGADADQVAAAAAELLGTQQPDGGWAQLDGGEPDAYATGTALWALHEAGGVAADAPAYRRGVGYLVRTQKGDGSWHVRTRSRAFQKYFETGFPHGKDQFISCAATGWAATALALACPPAN